MIFFYICCIFQIINFWRLSVIQNHRADGQNHGTWPIHHLEIQNHRADVHWIKVVPRPYKGRETSTWRFFGDFLNVAVTTVYKCLWWYSSICFGKCWYLLIKVQHDSADDNKSANCSMKFLCEGWNLFAHFALCLYLKNLNLYHCTLNAGLCLLSWCENIWWT